MTRTSRTRSKLAAAVLLFTACIMGLPSLARAAELVMFEHSGCPWCQMWHRTIGPIYPKSDEGKRAPLRRITLAPAMSLNFTLLEPVVATPTFVLVENGREIGRLTGYKDEESFWGLLGMLMQKLPEAS